MSEFALELQFFVPLAEGEYRLNIGGRMVKIAHTAVAHKDLDSRLGGIRGNFGFARDQFGLLRFSKLSTTLDDEDISHIGRVLLGGTAFASNIEKPEIRGRCALAVFNQFLDRYRAATRKQDIRPIRPGDLARLYQSDQAVIGEHSLYGGGFTLPVVGINPEAQQRVEVRLLSLESPARYELGALDALQALEDGRAREALILAASALEAAVDTYLSRIWRLSQPRTLTADATKLLKAGGARNRTIDDVLEAGQLSIKVKLDPVNDLLLHSSLVSTTIEAIELRNLIVHAGVDIGAKEVARHVNAVTTFVLDHLAGAIERDCPVLPRSELVYAYEEAMGTRCTPEIDQLVANYLEGAGLTAKLYNRKVGRDDMFSERYGDTLIIRISFQDFTGSKADQIELFIARSILYHWLRRRSDVPYARVAMNLPWEGAREFWSAVAEVMTRAVWDVAIERRLTELGFGERILPTNKQRATELRRKYGVSYSAPRPNELGHFVNYLEVARIASVLPERNRASYLKAVSRADLNVAMLATPAIKAMTNADFNDHQSLLNSLIAVHDVHRGILANVTVFDPKERKDYGFGTQFEDIFRL